jgi:hypothetical protein
MNRIQTFLIFIIILSEGDHGFGLGIGNEHVASWTNSLKLWLNWLNKKE